MLTKLQLPALLAGVIAYILAILGIVAFTTLVVSNESETSSGTLVLWLITWIFALLALTTGGLVAGWVAGKRGFLHGFVVGLLGSVSVGGVVQIFFPGLLSLANGAIVFGFLIPSIILTTLGGRLGQSFKAKREPKI